MAVVLHPGEGDASDDALTEAQHKCPSSLLHQERLLSGFGHKADDVSAVEGVAASSVRQVPPQVHIWNIPVSPQVLKVALDQRQDAVKPEPQSDREVLLKPRQCSDHLSTGSPPGLCAQVQGPTSHFVTSSYFTRRFQELLTD